MDIQLSQDIWWKFYLNSIKLFLQICQKSGTFVGISMFSILFQCLCLSHHHYHIVIIILAISQFSSVTESCPTLCNPRDCSRPPCPSPTPKVDSNSRPLSWWCHPIISASVVPFSSHLQSFPASGTFQVSQLFTSGGQSIGISASTSVFPMNVQGLLPLGWTGWISLQFRDSQESSSTPQLKASVLQCSAFFIVQPSHPYMTTEKTVVLTRQDFCWQSNVSAS